MKKLLICLLTLGMLLGGCSKGASNEKTYTGKGTGKGLMGDVVVEVVATEDKIQSIKVIEANETQGIGSLAIDQLPDKMVEANTVKVDIVTSATVTSNAIKEAVLDAIKNMGLDPEKFNKEMDEVEVEKTDATVDCDIVIVGAGGAGLTAAAMAAQNGAKVVVLEKMPIVGGNTLKATGGMNAAGTKFQEALGITDSTVETFIEDTMNGGHGINDKELVTVMAESSSEAVNWLESIGAPLPKVAATGGTVHKYLHEPEDGSAVGTYLVEKLSAFVEEQKDVTIMLNTEATEIITKDGVAAGVKANDKEHNYTINAKAVILTSGGFGANFDMMTEYNESLKDAVTTNAAGATGDGIKMATALGADTVDMEQIQLHPTVYQESGLLVSESVRSMGGILVNSEGKRFTNDMATRDAVSQAELKQDGAFAWIIFDTRIVDDLKSCKKYIDAGITVSANTYEELSKLMGFNAKGTKNLVETMKTWNAAVAAGEDKEFGRNNGMDGDLSTAPYYAIKIAPGIHHTMGGLKIDTTTHVLDTKGQAIPGLFAAGEVCGGVHGGNRIGGNAVCDIVVFGRIAGQQASEYIK